jgi:hypothetical protein
VMVTVFLSIIAPWINCSATSKLVWEEAQR